MSDAEEVYLDVFTGDSESEKTSRHSLLTSSYPFSIEGPHITGSENGKESVPDDEFFDVFDISPQTPQTITPALKKEGVRSETFVWSPPISEDRIPPKFPRNKRLTALEFLLEEPEDDEQEEKKEEKTADDKNGNRVQTIYEFLGESRSSLNSGEKKTSQPSASESSLSKLQSELQSESSSAKIPQESANIRVSLLPPSTSLARRESTLRRGNPLSTFFAATAGSESSGNDSDSMISELTEAMTIRTEISDLQLSRHASILGGNGDAEDALRLAKRYKPVPIKTKSKQKSEFSSLFLIQELNRKSTNKSSSYKSAESNMNRTSSTQSINNNNNANSSNPSINNSASNLNVDASQAIFALKFSPDGRFLAAAGAEGIVKIWKLFQVDASSAPNNNSNEPPPLRLAAIFVSEPCQILSGHDGEILDLAWSTNNFLLTASMDKTVRLWHHSRPDALGIFQHMDYVTSVSFHPRDPRIFLSGSLDCKLRLWSIQDRSILHWNELPPGNFITAVAFNRSGSIAFAGTSAGAALIFDTDGLRYNTQILVRSSRSKTFGKKITSIESVPGQYDKDERIIISSNDSRIRMYSLRDKNVIYKYKGHENNSSQIKASLSTDADFVLSGSEDCRVFLWRSDGKFQKKSFLFSSFRKDHIKSFESFKAHSNPVTAAIIAPNSVTNLLQSLQLRPINPLQSVDGKILITADITGQIKVFENNSKLIEWLK